MKNKNRCKIIYNNKEYDLKSKFKPKNNENLIIKLKIIYDLTNIKEMFSQCKNLISISILYLTNSRNDIVKIKTNDEKVYEIPYDIIKKAKILEYSNENDEIYLLSCIDSYNFDKVLEYLYHYKDKEPKEIPNPFPECTDDDFLRSILDDDWTFNFLQNLNVKETVELINSANDLQIEGLINLLSAKLACEISNCSVKDARIKFGIGSNLIEKELGELDRYPSDD